MVYVVVIMHCVFFAGQFFTMLLTHHPLELSSGRAEQNTHHIDTHL